VINHCDRPITLLSNTDTLVRHTMINHCDIRIPLLSDIDTVVRHSMINHCDIRITLLSNTDTVQSDISLFLVILTVVRNIA
jgi:hypothetical protein